MIRFAPGAIVRLRTPCGDSWAPARLEYVFVLAQPEPPFDAAHPEIRVAPISFAVEFATDVDLICAAGEGGLDQPFVVELWNQCAMLVEDLEPTAVGEVSSATLSHAYAVHNAMVDADEVVPEGVTGTPIEVDTDPRIRHQEHRADLAEALSRGAEALLAASGGAACDLMVYDVEVAYTPHWPSATAGVLQLWGTVHYPAAEVASSDRRTRESAASQATYAPGARRELADVLGSRSSELRQSGHVRLDPADLLLSA